MKKPIVVGRVSGVHGLQGWVKVHSWCDPKEALFDYRPLLIGSTELEEYEGRVHGKGLHLRPAGADRREDVEHLVGCDILVDRSQLPAPGSGEFYHVDLVGLSVRNREGETLGDVRRVLAGDANDVLVVAGKTELLIPFTMGHAIDSVSREDGIIVVDWQADWA